jgi:hypothetical protein
MPAIARSQSLGDPTGAFDRTPAPEEIMNKLEQRVGRESQVV